MVQTYDFETGSLPTGAYTVGYAGAADVVTPAAGLFDHTSPLAAPAGGGSVLRLSTPGYSNNFGIAIPTGLALQAGSTYTLSAAIGHALDNSTNDRWSLQLWLGAGGSDVSLNYFLGQQFGSNAGAANADAGLWVEDSFSVATDDPALAPLIGRQLVAFLNTYQSSAASYYDDVTVSAVVPDVGEPGWIGATMLALGLVTLRGRAVVGATGIEPVTLRV